MRTAFVSRHHLARECLRRAPADDAERFAPPRPHRRAVALVRAPARSVAELVGEAGVAVLVAAAPDAQGG